MVTSLNNELIAMLSTGESLYVHSCNGKQVLHLISGSGTTWNPIWVLGYNMFSTISQAMCVLNASTGYHCILLTVLEAC